MEVVNNAVAPFTASTGAVAGNAQRLVLEVLMSKILRRVLRMQDRSFMYLAAVHGLSFPLIGGFSGAVVPPGRLNDTQQLLQLTDIALSVHQLAEQQQTVTIGQRLEQLMGLIGRTAQALDISLIVHTAVRSLATLY